jgi:tetratricopeptide (TPR) repeat protein
MSKENKKILTVKINEQLDNKIDDALTLFENDDFFNAKIEIEKLYYEHSDYYLTNYAMGVIYIQENNLDEALKYLEKATDINPAFSQAYFNKGILYKERAELGLMASELLMVMQLENKDEKMHQDSKDFIDIIEKNEKSMTIYEYIHSDKLFREAFEYIDKKDYKNAKELFLQASEINKTGVQIYGNIGMCCMAIGQKNEAIVNLDKALKLDPKYKPAALHLDLLKNESIDFIKEHFATQEIKSIKYYADAMPQNKRSLINKFADKFQRN